MLANERGRVWDDDEERILRFMATTIIISICSGRGRAFVPVASRRRHILVVHPPNGCRCSEKEEKRVGRPFSRKDYVVDNGNSLSAAAAAAALSVPALS